MTAPIEVSEQGVQFVEHEGRRSSTRAGRTILAEAVAGADSAVADAIDATKDWRKDYLDPVRSVVEIGARSTKDALRIAEDGLLAVDRHLVFVKDAEDLPLREALKEPGDPVFTTETIQGEAEPATKLVVPYHGRELADQELLEQIGKWENAGIMEPSAANALRQVAQHPEWLDLSDRTFVMLGASSQMGPLEVLSKWRANIVAVDLPREHLWATIDKLVRRGAGNAHIPIRPDGTAGMDLLTETPATLTWLSGFQGPLTIGNYVYADGATFVRLAGAVDALVDSLLQQHADASLAYLATPTDVFAVPNDVVEGATGRRRGIASRVVRPITASRILKPNYDRAVEGEDGRSWGIADCLVPIQGPNYALAKALQRWRATRAREEGHVVSGNVAPSTRTMSVLKNRMLAAAYRGAGAFGIEIFEPETSRAVMAALLVHDLRSTTSASSPETTIGHPFDLFAEGAVHGGLWRVGYEPRSILPLALLLGLTKRH